MDEGLQVSVPLMNYSYYYCGNNGFRLYHPVGGNLEVPVSLHEQAVVSEQDMSDGSMTVGVCGVCRSPAGSSVDFTPSSSPLLVFLSVSSAVCHRHCFGLVRMSVFDAVCILVIHSSFEGPK